MLANMLIATRQVAILFIMALVGVISDKVGWFSESTAKKCTDILFYVITPAKILESFFTLEYSKETLKGLFIAIGAGLLAHAAAALGAGLFFNKTPPEQKAVYKYACVYGNCGYMGLPLVDAVVGSEGVFYCSAFVISFQIFTFTHGVWLMTRDSEEGKKAINLKKLILNPGVLPVFVGLPVFISGIKLPGIISTPVSSIAHMLSPLAMLIFGAYIAHTDFRSVFRNPRIFGVALFKLFAMPLAMMVALHFTGVTGALATTLLIDCATPPANNTAMFAAKYDKNTALGSQIVAVVSIISIFTLPFMIALGGIYV